MTASVRAISVVISTAAIVAGASIGSAAASGAANGVASAQAFHGARKASSTLAAKHAAMGANPMGRPSAAASAFGAELTAQAAATGRHSTAVASEPSTVTPPTTLPTLGPVGSTGVIALTATSDAPYVLFEVDGDAVDGQSTPTPVQEVDGSAAASFASWGTANGHHVVAAADCGAADLASCNTESAQATFVIANTAPTITAPAHGSAITGGFTVAATAPGGGIRFQIDGVTKGFDGAAPYRFSYTGSALATGHHSITVIECAASGSPCSGPRASILISSQSLRPSISAPSPGVFSPNGDGVKDTTAITYSLPDRETATISVINSAGATVRASGQGTLTGKHVWTWNGRSSANKVVPSGRYTVRLSTSAIRGGVTVRGQVSTAVTVDDTAPHLTSVTYATSIYPQKDGYKDTASVSFTTNETTAASLVIVGSNHKTVRTVTVEHSAGRVTIVWNGRGTNGHLVGVGTYSWHLTWHDGVGNKGTGSARSISVSYQTLVTKHKQIVVNGDSFWTAGGSESDCAEASTDLSTYVHGVWLSNVCDLDFDGVQVAGAFYHVTLPSAISYSRVTVEAGGFTFTPGTSMLVGYGKGGGTTDYAFGNEYTIPNIDEAYWGLGGINPTGLMNAKHVMNVAVNVTDSSSPGEFDIGSVRVTVTYVVLS